tara:strand:- start:660 stop:833 length:174 start_codon:yes stop_codon:yes gene_type:complete
MPLLSRGLFLHGIKISFDRKTKQSLDRLDNSIFFMLIASQGQLALEASDKRGAPLLF